MSRVSKGRPAAKSPQSKRTRRTAERRPLADLDTPLSSGAALEVLNAAAPEPKPPPGVVHDRAFWIEAVEDHLAEVRRRIDDLWYACEDATKDDPTFTPEGNQEGARAAVFEALQHIRAAERDLDALR
jgi:hypothetical protein